MRTPRQWEVACVADIDIIQVRALPRCAVASRSGPAPELTSPPSHRYSCPCPPQLPRIAAVPQIVPIWRQSNPAASRSGLASAWRCCSLQSPLRGALPSSPSRLLLLLLEWEGESWDAARSTDRPLRRARSKVFRAWRWKRCGRSRRSGTKVGAGTAVDPRRTLLGGGGGLHRRRRRRLRAGMGAMRAEWRTSTDRRRRMVRGEKRGSPPHHGQRRHRAVDSPR